jgi:hypothetical protein
MIMNKDLKPRLCEPEVKRRTFNLNWFDLPSYCFQLDYDPDGTVAGDDPKNGSETPPHSTEGG